MSYMVKIIRNFVSFSYLCECLYKIAFNYDICEVFFYNIVSINVYK